MSKSTDQSPVIVVGQSASKGNAGPSNAAFQNVKGRLGNIENITQAVLWVGLATIVAVVIAFGALVLDQMHFNNQTYRDQSNVNDLKYQEMTKQIELLSQKIESLNKNQDNSTNTVKVETSN